VATTIDDVSIQSRMLFKDRFPIRKPGQVARMPVFLFSDRNA
jgi:hypothetical protein